MKTEQVKVVWVSKSSFSTVRWRQIELRTEYILPLIVQMMISPKNEIETGGRFSWSWTRQAGNELRVYHQILTKNPVKILRQIQDLYYIIGARPKSL
jgi:hypothetical protein